ncbi:MAG: thiol reductase thioredoxin [Planctomycetota bacterium]|nr:MAG: thiol reductase thioredoxin [Planctomycetota bacterium]
MPPITGASTTPRGFAQRRATRVHCSMSSSANPSSSSRERRRPARECYTSSRRVAVAHARAGQLRTERKVRMLSAGEWRMAFEAGADYGSYVATGTESQQAGWRGVYERASLTPEQAKLVGGFVRDMRVLVLSGVWCGDCVQQCPLVQRIAEANVERIRVRYLDRDESPDALRKITINGGRRVPVVVFLAEDFEFVSLLGDRTLARYRAIARRQLGPSCPLPGAPVDDDELSATLADWLDEFERVQLLLRLSPRLRERHGD